MSTKLNTAAIQLSDPQREVLLAASRHPAGALVKPERLKGKAAQRVGDALLSRGLVKEVRCRAELPEWRQDAETGRRFSLVLTKAGRASVPADTHPNQAASLTDRLTAAAQPALMGDAQLAPTAQAQAVTEAATSTTLARRVAIGAKPARHEPAKGSSARRHRAQEGSVRQEGARQNGARQETAPIMLEASTPAPNPGTSTITSTAAESSPSQVQDAPRSSSKLADVLALLCRDEGTSLAEIVTATGWLPHTTRAALTRLRQRGYSIARDQLAVGAGSVYRIASAS